jgi:hypothetical protein
VERKEKGFRGLKKVGEGRGGLQEQQEWQALVNWEDGGWGGGGGTACDEFLLGVGECEGYMRRMRCDNIMIGGGSEGGVGGGGYLRG